MKKLYSLFVLLLVIISMSIVGCGGGGSSQSKPQIKQFEVTKAEMDKCIPMAKYMDLNEADLKEVINILKNVDVDVLKAKKVEGLYTQYTKGKDTHINRVGIFYAGSGLVKGDDKYAVRIKFNDKKKVEAVGINRSGSNDGPFEETLFEKGKIKASVNKAIITKERLDNYKNKLLEKAAKSKFDGKELKGVEFEKIEFWLYEREAMELTAKLFFTTKSDTYGGNGTNRYRMESKINYFDDKFITDKIYRYIDK